MRIAFIKYHELKTLRLLDYPMSFGCPFLFLNELIQCLTSSSSCSVLILRRLTFSFYLPCLPTYAPPILVSLDLMTELTYSQNVLFLSDRHTSTLLNLLHRL